jgi:hypothetical protein
MQGLGLVGIWVPKGYYPNSAVFGQKSVLLDDELAWLTKKLS